MFRKRARAQAEAALRRGTSAATPGESAIALTEAMRLFAVSGDHLLEARTRHALAFTHFRLGDHSQAAAQFTAVADSVSRHGDRHLEATARMHAGGMYYLAELWANAVGALSAAIDDTQALGMTDDYLASAHTLGMAYIRLNASRQAHPVFELADAVARDRGNLKQRAVAAGDLGFSLTQLGRHAEAVPYLREAAHAYLAFGDREAAADCTEYLAAALACSAEVATSQEALIAARDVFSTLDRQVDAVGCNFLLGAAFAQAGRWDTAETLLGGVIAQARPLLDSASEAEHASLSSILFHALTIMAMGRIGAADHRAANTMLDEAWTFAVGTHDLADLYCVQALCAAASGDANAAASLIESALALTTSAAATGDPTGRGLDANCRFFAGFLKVQQQNWTEAVALFEAARTGFARVGWTQSIALTDACAGLSMLGIATSSPPEERTAATASALDLLVPAHLYFDAVRLQFPDSASRQAWRDQVGWTLGVALRSCDQAGDARLAAELIETVINSGVHHVGDADDTTILPTLPIRELGRYLMPALSSADSARPDAAALAGQRSSALRLLDGGSGGRRLLGDLPMRSAPRLLMPNHVVALSRFHELRAARYPGGVSDTVCRTW